MSEINTGGPAIENGREVLRQLTDGLGDNDMCWFQAKYMFAIAAYVASLETALTDAIAFIENTIEDGSETEDYDRAFVDRLAALQSAADGGSDAE